MALRPSTPEKRIPVRLSPGFSDFATRRSSQNSTGRSRLELRHTGVITPRVLTALGGSFLDTNAALTLGAYQSYSTGSGDYTNALFDPSGRAILAHPSILTDAETQPGGALDARALAKVAHLPAPHTVQGITTGPGIHDLQFEYGADNDHSERGAHTAPRRGALFHQRCHRRVDRHQLHSDEFWRSRPAGSVPESERFRH